MLTDEILLCNGFVRYHIVNGFIPEEMEWLKRIEYKVAHVFVHISVNNTSVEIIDNATTVHHLKHFTEIKLCGQMNCVVSVKIRLPCAVHISFNSKIISMTL